MSFKGKNQKRAFCRGCNHWVKTIKIHLETGRVEVSPEYCDSEEVLSSTCSPYYPELSGKKEDEKIKKINEYFYKRMIKRENKK